LEHDLFQKPVSTFGIMLMQQNVAAVVVIGLNPMVTTMPFRRASFALTPPSMPIFLISLVLALLALLVHYTTVRIPIITPARAFDLLAIAYVVMLAGVLLRRV
jgi:hypothetical protein